MIASLGRRALWRGVLAVTGGLRVEGRLPDRPCVLVANHSSHADTPALLAALPARRRPVVAAAADYWFGRPGRAAICRALVAGFPVRRGGGGSGDLAAARALLASGHDVIVYPEGRRSRDGSLGEFHRGAARLAARAGAPLVPVGISGTHDLLPVHGTVHRGPVAVRIGAPTTDLTQARTAVASLSSISASGPASDSRLRCRIARLAGSRAGLVLVAAWAVAEAVSWPLLPESALAILVVARPRAGPRLAVAAVVGTLLGGALMYGLATQGFSPPRPLTTPRMHAAVVEQVAAHGAAAVRAQPMSGVPYKVYAYTAGRERVGLGAFVAHSAPARGLRLLVVGLLAAVFGAVCRPWRRWYPAYLVWFVVVFSGGLAAVVGSWR